MWIPALCDLTGTTVGYPNSLVLVPVAYWTYVLAYEYWASLYPSVDLSDDSRYVRHRI